MNDSDRPADSRVSAGRPTFTPPARGLRTSRAPRVPFAVLLGALVIGGMALLLVLNTASAANELGRQKYADADASVSAQVEQLRNEVAASAAPGNLASAAAALGMVPGGNPAFLIVGAGGTVVMRGSAAPASQVQVAVPKATTPKPSPSSPKPSPSSPKPSGSSTAASSTGTTSTGTTSAKSAPATASHISAHARRPSATATTSRGNRTGRAR